MDVRRTCTACRSAKVKCDRRSPVCGRCARLQLPCVEQVRKQGRPSSVTGSIALANSGVGPGAGSFPHASGLGVHSSEGGGQLISDFILQTFQHLLQSQTVDVTKTLKLLQMTSLLSTVFKADYLGGLSPKLLFFMRTSLSSLRDTQDVQAEMAELEQTLHVRWKGEELAFGDIHPSLRALDDPGAMVACITSVCGAACRVTTNHHFSELLCSAKELYHRMESESISPFIVWTKLVVSEDRLDFLEALTKYCFGVNKDMELSQIVKVKGRNDTSFLAIVRMRMVVLGNGRYVSVIFNASPAPSSKYLRGGNRDVEPYSGAVQQQQPPNASTSAASGVRGGPGSGNGGGLPLGLNSMESTFRSREPSPSLPDLKPDFVHANLGDERVKAFLQALGRAQPAQPIQPSPTLQQQQLQHHAPLPAPPVVGAAAPSPSLLQPPSSAQQAADGAMHDGVPGLEQQAEPAAEDGPASIVSAAEGSVAADEQDSSNYQHQQAAPGMSADAPLQDDDDDDDEVSEEGDVSLAEAARQNNAAALSEQSE